MTKKQNRAPPIPHKNTKKEICTCEIGMNHNTASSPHKDDEGTGCRGAFEFKNPERRSEAEWIRFAKRSCRLCRREETYSPIEIIIVFKEGTSDIQAGEFILNFRIGEHSAMIINDPTRNIVKKNDTVAITVSIAAAAGKSVDEWITEIEQQEPVWFASPRMIVAYPDPFALPTAVHEPMQERKSDFPDEFQNQ